MLKGTILVISTEINVGQNLTYRFCLDGYFVLLATDDKTGLTLFHHNRPDITIINISTSELIKYKLCFNLRKISLNPIILLTYLTTDYDNFIYLNLGVVEIIKKPFLFKELNIQVKLNLLKTKYTLQNLNKKYYFYLLFKNIKVDLTKRKVFKVNKKIELTRLEFNLLELFISQEGKILSRGFILRNLWGSIEEKYFYKRVIDVHISNLRTKLEDDPYKPSILITARGLGYMMKRFLKTSDYN
jgi:OmpR family response regulator RpaB